MWLFLPFGFFSVVRKPNDTQLCVRSRDAESLLRLRRLIPSMGPVITQGGTDYPHRAFVDPRVFGVFLAHYANTMDVPNFKDAAQDCRGPEFHDLCASVWATMFELEDR